MDYNIHANIHANSICGIEPVENFLFALKAKESKRRYLHRLDKFLTFLEFQGTIEEKCARLYEFSKNNFDQLESSIIRFINLQKDRIESKEMAATSSSSLDLR